MAEKPEASPQAAPLTLASASPRRLALLRQVGVEPQDVVPAEIDESPLRRELPRDYARRMAAAKAAAVASGRAERFILGADTVVAMGRRIFPKAENIAVAKDCLTKLSGRSHMVLGAVFVLAPDGRGAGRLVTTRVTFKRLSAREIDDYLCSGEWQDKAGGYAIQGRAGAFVAKISGSYPNVVGLPLMETLALLEGLGWRRARARP